MLHIYLLRKIQRKENKNLKEKHVMTYYRRVESFIFEWTGIRNDEQNNLPPPLFFFQVQEKVGWNDQISLTKTN